MSTQRRTGRIAFRVPRPAKFGSTEVYMIDLSLHGAGIRHQARIAPGTESELHFKLEKQEHSVGCRLSRSKLELVQRESGMVQMYRSGMAFTALDTEVATLRDALRKRVHRALQLQKANALAKPELAEEAPSSSGGIDLTILAPWIVDDPFIKCTLDQKRRRWKKKRTSSSEQPEIGFTVLVDEGEAEIEKLCRTYEGTDDEGRNLIRLFAHLSLTETSEDDRDQFVT